MKKDGEMYKEVKVPRTAINDDFVELVEWYVNDGTHVEEGTLLCAIETSKTSFEILAERSGFLKILALQGERVPIQETICLLCDSLDELQDYVSKRKPGANQDERFEATRKAVELAEGLEIDLMQINKRGIIREKDVQRFHTKRQAGPAASAKVAMKPADQGSMGEVTANLPTRDASLGKRVIQAILFILRPPFRATMWILCRVPLVRSLIETLVRTYSISYVGYALRSAFYRNTLMRMGRGVRIETGALLVSPGAIEIGDRSRIDSNVRIVGSTPERPISIGKGVHIGSGTIIHGTGGVTIGDYAAVAAGSIIYSARNLPEDPSRPGQLISMSHAAPEDNQYKVWASVVIEEYAFIGLNVSILPGVTIGRGAIVNSGAVIASDVSAYSIVGGPKFSIIGHRSMKDGRNTEIS
jgi:acetyltransferase-like isoleucine patch superfamily enzyme